MDADRVDQSGLSVENVVVARTQGERRGSVELWGVGYFDEDDIADTAFFRLTARGTYQLAAALSGSGNIIALAEVDSVASMGVRTVGPGTYIAACAKESGPKCRSQDEESVRLDRDGILLVRYESSAHLIYLKDEGFASAWLSD